MSALERLLALAFAQGDARGANTLIQQVRQQVEALHGQAVSYEVALIGRGWEHLRQEVAPKLALFLRGKQLGAWTAQAVFVSLFVGERLYFIRVPDFFQHLRQEEGLDLQTFEELLQRWAETGTRAHGVLPPGPSRDAS